MTAPPIDTSAERVRVSEREARVLAVLARYWGTDGPCVYFITIAREARMTIRRARLATRSLARKGLAEYVRGLFDDEGMVAGSGYCCTPAGLTAHRARAVKEPTE